jgi:hypothetical protein
MGPKVIPLPYALFHYLLSKAQIKKTTNFGYDSTKNIISST